MLTLICCKDKINETGAPKEVDLTNVFVFSIDVIAPKTDNFSLFYTEDGSINFGNKVIWSSVKGSQNEQRVQFLLPKNAFPTQFRLDLGTNHEQDEIIVKAISFKFNKKEKIIKGKELGVFFRADLSKCTFDMKTGVIKTIVKDNKKQGFSLYPLEPIQAAELPKLYK